MHHLVIHHNQDVVAIVPIKNIEDWVTIDLDGRSGVGFDFFYSDGTQADPVGSTEAKLVLGCWPDGEQWKRLAIIPLSGEPIERADGIDAL